jgi:hypothetical protein
MPAEATGPSGFSRSRSGYDAVMGLAFSLVVIAVGAILAFAVTDDVSGIDIEVVGWILMAVGGVGFLLTLAFWSSWWGPGYWRRERYVEGDPYDRRPSSGRRERIVEEEDAPPPAPPP